MIVQQAEEDEDEDDEETDEGSRLMRAVLKLTIDANG